MPVVNYASREITCKIVYYGPGRSGKTTNLQYIHRRVPADRRGEMMSLATHGDRTLFFDFLPLDLGTVRGFKTRFHLYTVPGQVYYNASRKPGRRRRGVRCRLAEAPAGGERGELPGPA